MFRGQELGWARRPTPGGFWEMDGWAYSRIPQGGPLTITLEYAGNLLKNADTQALPQIHCVGCG